MIKKKLKIEGMHCNSCALSIDFDLEDIEGVSSVRTSYAAQVCEIEFDEGRVSEEQIIGAIKMTGYQAEIQ